MVYKKDKKNFIKYGRWDTDENARNGLKGDDTDKISKARRQAYKIREKEKEILSDPSKY